MPMTPQLYRYRLPLTSPLMLGGSPHLSREGVLLHQAGHWADAAPLPGFSRESLSELTGAICREWPLNETHQITSVASSFPSLQFALSSIRSPQRACRVPVNALLLGTAEAILAKAEELAGGGCQAVKLKVGRQTVEEDVQLVVAVRRKLRDDQQLRLDANRAWHYDDAIQFAKGLNAADVQLQYIEEPLAESRRLAEWHYATALPYALDETLHDTISAAAVSANEGEAAPSLIARLRTLHTSNPQAAAWIVKPTLLGDTQWIPEIANLGVPFVFSSCFESGVGIAQVARLASQLAKAATPDGTPAPAGLDTYDWLAEDVLRTRLTQDDWWLDVPTQLEVDPAYLEPLS